MYEAREQGRQGDRETKGQGEEKRMMEKIIKLIARLLRVFPNRSIDEAINMSKKLFDKAEHSIKIVSGSLDHSFYESFLIVDALKRASDRGVEVEIVCGPDVDGETSQLFDLADAGKIKLYQLDRRPSVHFIVVDGKHVRIEEYHTPFQPERRAYIMFDTISLGKRLNVEFAKMRDKLESGKNRTD